METETAERESAGERQRERQRQRQTQSTACVYEEARHVHRENYTVWAEREIIQTER